MQRNKRRPSRSSQAPLEAEDLAELGLETLTKEQSDIIDAFLARLSATMKRNTESNGTAKPRNPRHFDTIGGGRNMVGDRV